jgi:uncharacterized membrane protein
MTTSKYFNFTDVLGYGWRVMKANLGFFVGLGLVWLIVSYLPTVANIIIDHLALSKFVNGLLSFLMNVLSWVIGIVFGIGFIKIALSFCDEKRPSLGTLFDAWDCFWRYLGAGILYMLIVFAGFFLLIFPGIIWSIKYGLCWYFVVDKGLGPVQALKASNRTTMGVKWDLFGFGILCALINFLGLLCLVVGIFATWPTVMVAYALVYRQLLAQTPELAELGILTSAVQPQA